MQKNIHERIQNKSPATEIVAFEVGDVVKPIGDIRIEAFESEDGLVKCYIQNHRDKPFYLPIEHKFFASLKLGRYLEPHELNTDEVDYMRLHSAKDLLYIDAKGVMYVYKPAPDFEETGRYEMQPVQPGRPTMIVIARQLRDRDRERLMGSMAYRSFSANFLKGKVHHIRFEGTAANIADGETSHKVKLSSKLYENALKRYKNSRTTNFLIYVHPEDFWEYYISPYVIEKC